MKLDKYIEQYLRVYGETWKPSTRTTYADLLKLYISPVLGDEDIAKIKKSNLIEFFRDLIKVRGLSASRVQMVLALLGKVFADAFDNDEIEKNPMLKAKSDILSMIKHLCPEKDNSEQAYTMEEIDSILAHLDPFYVPVFTVLALTGARPNEVLALRWTDIDFDANSISISKGRVRGEEGSTKTNVSRVIPMHPRIKEVLRGLPIDSPHVFTTKKRSNPETAHLSNRPIDGNLSRLWNAAAARAGVPARRSYMLRHSVVSNALSAGIDPVTVKTLAGHASLQTTMSYYAKSTKNTFDKMAEALNVISEAKRA